MLVSVRVLLPIAFYVAVIPPTLRYDEMLTILIPKHDGNRGHSLSYLYIGVQLCNVAFTGGKAEKMSIIRFRVPNG